MQYYHVEPNMQYSPVSESIVTTAAPDRNGVGRYPITAYKSECDYDVTILLQKQT